MEMEFIGGPPSTLYVTFLTEGIYKSQDTLKRYRKHPVVIHYLNMPSEKQPITAYDTSSNFPQKYRSIGLISPFENRFNNTLL